MLGSSVVLCTKDRADDMRRCLGSIRSQSRVPDELIVVDSGSDDTEIVIREFASTTPNCAVRYIRSEPGLTLQRNIGIRAATMQILHFFDDDCELEPDYILEMQRPFEEDGDQKVLGAGPRLILCYQPSARALAMRKFFLMPYVRGDGRLLRSGFGSYSWLSPSNEPHRVEVLCGCCSFRKEVFDHVMFDEHFKGYGYLEDLDFSFRVGRLGELVCNPCARITHWESPSARMNWRRMAKMEIVNHYYVFKKNCVQSLFGWLCFWWSEVGMSLRRFGALAKTKDLNILRGMADGYWSVLRGQSTP